MSRNKRNERRLEAMINTPASMPATKHPFDFDNDEIPGVPLARELKDVTREEMDAIMKRVAAFKKQYPLGVPEYKRPGPYRVYIFARDIMLISKCSLRTAQRLLQNTRFVKELPKGALVKIEDFCNVNEKFEVEDVRAFLEAVDAADDA